MEGTLAANAYRVTIMEIMMIMNMVIMDTPTLTVTSIQTTRMKINR